MVKSEVLRRAPAAVTAVVSVLLLLTSTFCMNRDRPTDSDLEERDVVSGTVKIPSGQEIGFSLAVATGSMLLIQEEPAKQGDPVKSIGLSPGAMGSGAGDVWWAGLTVDGGRKDFLAAPTAPKETAPGTWVSEIEISSGELRIEVKNRRTASVNVSNLVNDPELVEFYGDMAGEVCCMMCEAVRLCGTRIEHACGSCSMLAP